MYWAYIAYPSEVSDQHVDQSPDQQHDRPLCCRFSLRGRESFSSKIMAFEVPNDGDFYLGEAIPRRHDTYTCPIAQPMYPTPISRRSPSSELLLYNIVIRADPPTSNASDQTGLLVLVAPLTISTKAYVPLVKAVQVCAVPYPQLQPVEFT